MVMMVFSRPDLVSASAIADELSLSPVVVRRTLAKLVKAGLISSSPGPAGGYSILDDTVALSMILQTVRGGSGVVARQFDVPVSSCEEGLAVDEIVAEIYAEADDLVDELFSFWTVAGICETARGRLS